MDEIQKNNSYHKKAQLQARLAVKEQSARLVEYWYPVWEVIVQSGIAWSLACLDCVTGLKFSCWQETPVTGNWLLFRSLEDEWRWGYSG